ncbi:YjhX family toxin [Vibrio chagasii]|uniref:YjhX family toxin n=1 Tax=Vibrio chagasii TaxID=170679 RepID=UPI0038CD2777
MNISKQEQRVLHILAMGGGIRRYLNEDGKLTEIICFTREGYSLSNCTMEIFKKLKSKKLISSKNGQPYRITLLGATSVQAQMNQR